MVSGKPVREDIRSRMRPESVRWDTASGKNRSITSRPDTPPSNAYSSQSSMRSSGSVGRYGALNKIKSNFPQTAENKSLRIASTPFTSRAWDTACGLISTPRVFGATFCTAPATAPEPVPISITESSGFTSARAALINKNVSSAG